MNIVQTVSFACTASAIYRKSDHIRSSHRFVCRMYNHGFGYDVMELSDYPALYGILKRSGCELLLPAFLPFNLFKSVLNAAITFLLYKPVITALRKSSAQTCATFIIFLSNPLTGLSIPSDTRPHPGAVPALRMALTTETVRCACRRPQRCRAWRS